MRDIPFLSRRNQLFFTFRQGRPMVEKYFPLMEDWAREKRMYEVLAGALPVPAVCEAAPGVLWLEYLPYPTLLAELERQEAEGFETGPWEALAGWMSRCHARTGVAPDEGNLRNFLWDGRSGRVYGLDLESLEAGPLVQSGAAAAAAVLDYAPAETPVKRRAAAVLTERLGVPAERTAAALAALRSRREHAGRPELSGVVLAGGASSRMGADKSTLLLGGRTLLELQVEKLRALGIRDILLSGAGLPQLPGTRVIADERPGQGPLGGLHACLKRAENPACLVLSVDVPLVPVNILAQLCRTHRGGATVLQHGEAPEPLIGVYDSALSETAAALLAEGRRSVRAMGDAAACTFFPYLGPEELLCNCNTPEDFSAVQNQWASYKTLKQQEDSRDRSNARCGVSSVWTE